MPNSLSLLSFALCSLTLAQRPPVPRPDPSSNMIAFPRESDIVFPDRSESNESRESRRIERLFKLVEFQFNSSENVPNPKPPPRHLLSLHKPGQPFPPPPNGRRQKKRKHRRRLCEHSEWELDELPSTLILMFVIPKEYSEYMERIFPNDTGVAEDANDDEFDGRVLARPGQYPHMVHALQADKTFIFRMFTSVFRKLEILMFTKPKLRCSVSSFD